MSANKIKTEVKLEENINTNRQFFELMHDPSIQDEIDELATKTLYALEHSVEEFELKLKDALAEKYQLKSSNGKAVKIMVKAGESTSGIFQFSIYPKWLPRKASQFKDSK